MERRVGKWLGLAAVAVGAGLIMGSNLGGYALWDPDEAKHAEIAREMLLHVRGLEPTINFEAYHHKPSFLYLIIGLCYRLLGVTELAARMVPALAAFFTLLAVYWYCASDREQPEPVSTGWLAAGLLGSTGLFVFVGRFVNFDSLVTALSATSMLYFARWTTGARRPRGMYLFYALLALSVLVKGPMTLILVAVPLGFALYSGELAVRDLRVGAGALIGIAIVGAWAVPAGIMHPDYLWDFIWNHNIRRYTVADHLFHPQPFYFFIPVLLGGLLPWSLLLWDGVKGAVRRGGADRILAVYALWVVIFFSASTGKLATYVLPAVPVLAVLVARQLVIAHQDSRFALRRVVSWEAGVLLLLPIAGVVAALIERSISPLHGLSFAPAAAAGAYVLWSRRGRAASTLAAQSTLCLGSAVAMLLLGTASAGALSAMLSDADLAAAARQVPEVRGVIAYRVRPYSFQFYWGDRLIHGSTPEAYRDPELYRAALSSGETFLLLTKDKYVAEFLEMTGTPPLVEVARNHRHVLFSTKGLPRPSMRQDASRSPLRPRVAAARAPALSSVSEDPVALRVSVDNMAHDEHPTAP